MELKNINEDKNIIEEVYRGSIADELGLEVGDTLLSINGKEVKDILEYKFLISDDFVLVEVEKRNGEIWEIEIEKGTDEDLGIAFANSLIDRAKSCSNKCIFCYIDQLPENMRETLYFKDDDSRLSFLQGNFITLTNMSDEEIDRIIEYRLSPVNVSVHTTNPELRVEMLNNKNAGKLYDILKRFHQVGLEVNCQIVLMPGVNDGEELERTLEDLSALHSTVKSVAIVPIGVTKFRKGLKDLKVFDPELAGEFLDYIHRKQEEYLRDLGTRFVFAGDEFYAMAERSLPEAEAYEGYPQYENGVGMMKSLEDEVALELENVDPSKIGEKDLVIATGTLAKDFMIKIAGMIMDRFENLKIQVVPIKNDFFGHSITVVGLITAGDLISQLEDYRNVDGVIIPRNMMKSDEEVFLDDLDIEDVRESLRLPVAISRVDGRELINTIINLG